MRTVELEVTQPERELLTTMGTVAGAAPGKVSFTFPDYLSMQEVMENVERSITFQESDHGCWVRAQEYRAAKTTLLSKLRKAILTPV